MNYIKDTLEYYMDLIILTLDYVSRTWYIYIILMLIVVGLVIFQTRGTKDK